MINITSSSSSTTNAWPALPLTEWKDTYDTLHRWTQIVGKIRLALTPRVNHWWNSTLYITLHGLTTSAMYYNGSIVQIDFDFISHLLIIVTSDNPTKTISLRPCSVAEFYQDYGSIKITWNGCKYLDYASRDANHMSLVLYSANQKEVADYDY